MICLPACLKRLSTIDTLIIEITILLYNDPNYTTMLYSPLPMILTAPEWFAIMAFYD